MAFVEKLESVIPGCFWMETVVLNAVKTVFLVQIFLNVENVLMDLNQLSFLLADKLLLHVAKFVEMVQDLLKNVMTEISKTVMDAMNTVKLKLDGTVMVEEL